MDAWQVPVLATAALVVSELVVYVAARRLRHVTLRRMAGIAALGLFILLAVVGLAVFGPEQMDHLASVASAILGAVAIWLTYETYRARGSKQEEPPA
jgi:purine-cytosine permease-like protein